MRSKLFVPASRPELIAKALAGPADAISLDLEDAVVEARKNEARETLRDWLQANGLAMGVDTQRRPKIMVRVNAMDTPHFEADIAAIVQPGVDIINLPKPHSAQTIHQAVALIEQAEKANGVSKPVQLLVNVETPRSLRLAHELANAHARVMGLQAGLVDLFEACGIDRSNPGAVEHVLLTIKFAAAEAGVLALDAAYANVKNPEGFLAEATLAKRLGFNGKTCIHPSQVPLANQAFQASDMELAHAREIMETWAEQEKAGMGAFMLNGQMIDKPFIERARRLLKQAS